jgi:hypothetical protein
VRVSARCLQVAGLLVLVVLGGALTGCGSDEAACPPQPRELLKDRDVAMPPTGPLDDASLSKSAPSLVIQVTNSEPPTERVRLALNGESALDVDLSGARDCWGGHAPIFSLGYDLPAGPVEAALMLQDELSTETIEVPATGTVWAVVDVQSQRSWGDITLYDTQPEWG